jgi:hypothetical protein
MLFRSFLFLLIFFNSIFAANEFRTTENSVFSNSNVEKKLPNTLPSNYTLDNEDIIKTKNIHLQYTSYPKKAYAKQKFTVSLKAIISLNNLTKINTIFKNYEGVKILNENNKWVLSKDEENIYTNSFDFIITSDKFEMPLIKLDIYVNGKYKESAKIPPKKIEFKKIVLATKNF